MSTTIMVSPITEETLEACTRLFVNVFNDAPWHDQWTFERAHRRLSDVLASPGFIGFLATEESGSLAGFVMGNSEQWYDGTHFFYLREMCVRGDLQRQGVGGKLLEVLENHLRTSVSLVFLLTMGGGQAENFYAKHGFAPSSEMIMMTRRFG